MPLKGKFREEMEFLRRAGRDFARDNPQLARFLGEEASDPDVERLLEGFAFLTAKLSLKIEDDLPELTHSMLQLLWPNYLRPLPSVTMMRFDPIPDLITERMEIPKGTPLLSRPVDGVHCQFRTCTDITLFPLRIAQVTDAHSREKSIMRVELEQTTDKIRLSALECEQLDFHLSGSDTTAQTLYLWLSRYLEEVRVEGGSTIQKIRPTQIEFPGFEPNEALLPYPRNVFDGYRILQEYFIFPQRFHFFRLTQLRSLWPSVTAPRLRLEFHFSRPMPVDIRLHDDALALFCTPAVNLFQHDGEPINLDGRAVNQRLMPAGHHPNAYEIFSVDQVSGSVRQRQDKHESKRGPGFSTHYHPFESLQHEIEHGQGRTSLYYRLRIEPSLDSKGVAHRIAFVREDESDHIGENETVSIALTCSNRDLPRLLGVGDICLRNTQSPSFATFCNITAPTPSYRPVMDGALQWTLISNLSLNYLSLLSIEPLKAVIRAYDFAALHDIQRARTTRKRLEAVHNAVTTPVDRLVRGLPVRGIRTRLELDQSGFLCEGDLYLFGAVLSHFFALYASINSFHMLEAVNTSNNERYSWPTHLGKQPLI